jgi:nucleotide-binding universal stress UspA family protein
VLNKILVSLDGSNNSLRGLEFALVVAKQSESTITDLNVHSPLMAMQTSIVKHKVRQKSKEIIEQAEKLSKKANVPFSGIIKVSNIGKTISVFAERHKVDMTVMCSRGTDPEIVLFLGGVANHIINKSKIFVTIIK